MPSGNVCSGCRIGTPRMGYVSMSLLRLLNGARSATPRGRSPSAVRRRTSWPVMPVPRLWPTTATSPGAAPCARSHCHAVCASSASPAVSGVPVLSPKPR